MSESDYSNTKFVNLQLFIQRKSQKKLKNLNAQCELERKVKELEFNLNSETNFNEYTKSKSDLELIYEEIDEGVKISSKCQWFEEGEKSIKFFINLKKNCEKTRNK